MKINKKLFLAIIFFTQITAKPFITTNIENNRDKLEHYYQSLTDKQYAALLEYLEYVAGIPERAEKSEKYEKERREERLAKTKEGLNILEGTRRTAAIMTLLSVVTLNLFPKIQSLQNNSIRAFLLFQAMISLCHVVFSIPAEYILKHNPNFSSPELKVFIDYNVSVGMIMKMIHKGSKGLI